MLRDTCYMLSVTCYVVHIKYNNIFPNLVKLLLAPLARSVMRHVTCYMLHVTWYMLHVTCYLLHVTCYVWHVTWCILQATTFFPNLCAIIAHAPGKVRDLARGTSNNFTKIWKKILLVPLARSRTLPGARAIISPRFGNFIVTCNMHHVTCNTQHVSCNT